MAEILPIILVLIAVPLSMLMWAGNLAFSFISDKEGTNEVIPPIRWLAATLLPLVVAAWGLKKKSLNRSGAFLEFPNIVVRSVAYIPSEGNWAALSNAFTLLFGIMAASAVLIINT